MRPVHNKSHNGCEDTLAQHSKQSNVTNLFVLNVERTEIVNHHSQPTTKHSLDTKSYSTNSPSDEIPTPML